MPRPSSHFAVNSEGSWLNDTFLYTGFRSQPKKTESLIKLAAVSHQKEHQCQKVNYSVIMMATIIEPINFVNVADSHIIICVII